MYSLIFSLPEFVPTQVRALNATARTKTWVVILVGINLPTMDFCDVKLFAMMGYCCAQANKPLELLQGVAVE